VWLWELLAAVEQGNETILTRAKEMNINPKKVAKRLLWVNYWAWSENLFFHANPQPYNIIIGKDSKLYFINFTLTGSLSRSKRQAMRQNFYYAWRRDPQNMARSFLILMEPLPPIDLIELTQELEAYNWQLLYALEAAPESLTWQERTSAIQWIGMIQLARKYGIAIDMQVLLQMRSTLLCESIAVRLHQNIDFVREYRKFNRYVAEQTRRRLTDSILDTLDGKTNEQLIIGLDRFTDTVQGIFFRTRHMLSLPSVNFKALMSKWSYAVFILVRFLALLLGVTVISAILTSSGLFFGGGQPVSALAVLQSVITNPIYQIIVLILILSSGRTVLFRMDDKEV
jgi:predicted unusual protein kinase regulating ubiquinone biosynthesis (AarF/ABC1/UbiB family)